MPDAPVSAPLNVDQLRDAVERGQNALETLVSGPADHLLPRAERVQRIRRITELLPTLQLSVEQRQLVLRVTRDVLRQLQKQVHDESPGVVGERLAALKREMEAIAQASKEVEEAERNMEQPAPPTVIAPLQPRSGIRVPPWMRDPSAIPGRLLDSFMNANTVGRAAFIAGAALIAVGAYKVWSWLPWWIKTPLAGAGGFLGIRWAWNWYTQRETPANAPTPAPTPVPLATLEETLRRAEQTTTKATEQVHASLSVATSFHLLQSAEAELAALRSVPARRADVDRLVAPRVSAILQLRNDLSQRLQKMGLLPPLPGVKALIEGLQNSQARITTAFQNCTEQNFRSAQDAIAAEQKTIHLFVTENPQNPARLYHQCLHHLRALLELRWRAEHGTPPPGAPVAPPNAPGPEEQGPLSPPTAFPILLGPLNALPRWHASALRTEQAFWRFDRQPTPQNLEAAQKAAEEERSILILDAHDAVGAMRKAFVDRIAAIGRRIRRMEWDLREVPPDSIQAARKNVGESADAFRTLPTGATLQTLLQHTRAELDAIRNERIPSLVSLRRLVVPRLTEILRIEQQSIETAVDLRILPAPTDEQWRNLLPDLLRNLRTRNERMREALQNPTEQTVRRATQSCDALRTVYGRYSAVMDRPPALSRIIDHVHSSNIAFMYLLHDLYEVQHGRPFPRT